MTVLKHEIRQGRTAFLIWTCAIASLLAVCIFLYPEMKDEMGNVTDMFASMGAFSAAFGMDRLNFGSLTGFSQWNVVMCSDWMVACSLLCLLRACSVKRKRIRQQNSF